MKALARITHQSSQTGFDVEMNVLKVNRPLELSPCDLFTDQGHSALNICQITAGQNPARMKHAGVCERPYDVLLGESLVELDRSGVTLHPLGDGLRKTPRPSVGFVRKLVCHSGS